MDGTMTNITPILEHVFGTSKIGNERDLQLLIKALEEGGDRKLFDSKAMSELMERFQALKSADEASADKQ